MNTSVGPRKLRDPALYDFIPYEDRQRIKWPNGARVAFWMIPNIEFYELHPPANPLRRAWGRPDPDVLNYAVRDYGNRVGIWRMMEVMERYRVRGTVSLNVAVCDHHPDIIEACCKLGWEFFSHGVYNTRYLYGMDKSQEREVIRDSRAAIEKHTGQRLDGWLSPSLTNTENTFELLAEAGVKYALDLFHDDQPTPLKVKSGKLISLPYSWEINDAPMFALWNTSPSDYGDILRSQFDQLYAEGAESGTVMGVPLHPFRLGQPNRIKVFEDVLRYITSHEGVWLATGREIADWYYQHYYEAAIAAWVQQAGNSA